MFGKANALTPIDTLLSAGWEGAKTFGERMTPLTGAQRIQISSTGPERRHNRDEYVMIHHLSIAARDPRHVAEVLAEFMGGAATRFTPNPGSCLPISTTSTAPGSKSTRPVPSCVLPVRRALDSQ